jgi:hypothetical protein
VTEHRAVFEWCKDGKDCIKLILLISEQGRYVPVSQLTHWRPEKSKDDFTGKYASVCHVR